MPLQRPKQPLQTPNMPQQRPISTAPQSVNDQQCGQHNPNGQTVIDEFPWVVSIGKRRKNAPNDIQYKCGGSLIHSHVILTAQHCVLS